MWNLLASSSSHLSHEGFDVEWITELPVKYPHIVQQLLTNLSMPSHSDNSLSPATELSRN